MTSRLFAQSLALAGLLLGALFGATPLMAAPATYAVVVDTSSLAGTTGSLDFQFNPGPLSAQAASASILGFTSDGSAGGAPVSIGDVTGSLPGTISFDNAAALNDYFTEFTFGNFLSFDISLSGDALDAPDGTSTSGSTFAFSIFGDAAGTLPQLTSDRVNGFAYVVDINLDGSTVANSFLLNQSRVPEPGSLALAGLAGLLGLLALNDGRRRTAALV